MIEPKLKTNSGASKRFRKTAKSFKHYNSKRRHNLGHKDRKVNRHARSGGSNLVHESDLGRVSALQPKHKKEDNKTREKRGVMAGRRHKKILGKAKGYYNARRKVFRAAKQAVIKAGQYAYRDRRQKKREFRALWIARINAAARLHGLSYSRMINGLMKAEVEIDRKMLADLAVHDAAAFGAIAAQAKAALGIA